MKLFRTLLAALLMLAMILPLASCQQQPLSEETVETQETTEEEKNETPGVEQSSMPLTEYSIDDLEGNVKLLGERTAFVGGEELVVEWAGSGFEMNVDIGEEGTDLRIGFRCNYTAIWKVFVDGELWGDRVTTKTGNRKQIVAYGIPAGEHTISLVKDSEPANSRNNYNSILSVAFNGEFLEPAGDKELYLEFIGDGYMTGFGNLGNGGTSTKAKIVEETSVTAALPYLTAQALDADYSIVGRSKIGLKTVSGSFALPALYDNQHAFRLLDETYDPDRVPDAIVIHLGMDDSQSSLSAGDFIVTAKDFIDTLRDYYGGVQVPVIWMYNTMYHSVRTGEIKALIEYVGDDYGVYVLEMSYGASGSALSDGDPYPNAEEHQKSVDILVPFLKELLNK